MRKTVLTLLILTTIFMVGCQGNRVSEQLAQIDSMLVHDQVDSAKTCLDRIQIAKIDNKADSAYYYLLLAESRYRLKGPDSSDSSTNFSINYYKDTFDKEKLARAYYYKGVNIYNSTKPQEGILLIKQAEEQANKTKSYLLKHKIYEKLSYYNGRASEYVLSQKYAKQAYQIAQQLDDRERQAIALLYMANNYSRLGKTDSLAACAQQCLLIAEYITEEDRSYLYTRIGELYEKNDSEIAKNYLLRAIEIHPMLRTYLTLSNIYLKEGDIAKAQEVWDRALKMNGSTKVKIDILKAMRQQSLARKDYLQANALADSILQMQKQFYDGQREDQVAEIQAKYDKETAVRDLREKYMGFGLWVLALTAIIIAFLGYKSRQGMKAKKELAESKVQLDAYTKKAAELESSGKASASEIKKLHDKINDLTHRHSGILAKGKELYEAIESGSTTVRWSKEDFINYLEYYKLHDLPFVNEMENDYNRLSPKYIFFAVLEHQGKSDEDIQRIMGVSDSTLRSTRSRINSKKR
jgi:tetratricopeptide (TPR) repeat protein